MRLHKAKSQKTKKQPKLVVSHTGSDCGSGRDLLKVGERGNAQKGFCILSFASVTPQNYLKNNERSYFRLTQLLFPDWEGFFLV